jgi:hypothetical protein
VNLLGIIYFRILIEILLYLTRKGGISLLIEELYRFIGQTVTIFVTGGGASGSGFTGVLLRVNPCFVTLVHRLGTPPANPLGNGMGSNARLRDGRDNGPMICSVGSVFDIPINKIAAFSHNAI